jgi:hypothetical protein
MASISPWTPWPAWFLSFGLLMTFLYLLPFQTDAYSQYFPFDLLGEVCLIGHCLSVRMGQLWVMVFGSGVPPLEESGT